MGVVMDPEPVEGEIPRTVSMTWADECDVQVCSPVNVAVFVFYLRLVCLEAFSSLLR